MKYNDYLNPEDYQVYSIFEFPDDHFQCPECGEIFPNSEAYILPKEGLKTWCKDCHKFNRKLHYLKTKEHTNKKVYEYQRKSRKRKDWHLKYLKKRKQSDPLFNLIVKIRTRTKDAFRRKNWKKEDSITKALGCSLEELKIYFESKFTEGMSWEKVFSGEIHIDHIKALSHAKNEEEMYKLAHYTNLQPLWAKDNLKKSNKL
jgi:hypothetical protein